MDRINKVCRGIAKQQGGTTRSKRVLPSAHSPEADTQLEMDFSPTGDGMGHAPGEWMPNTPRADDD